MQKIADRVAAGETLLSDGAWGTLLQEKGLEPGGCPDLWSLTHPDDVVEIARSYVDAGADMIETNSFGASSLKLAHFGLAERASEINEAAAALSRRAAGPDRHVLGSVGPTGVILMMEEVSPERVYESFRQQIAALERGGADAVCIETMSALDEALAAIRAARAATQLEIICTFTFDRTAAGEYRTMMGVSPRQMAQTVTEAGANIIGANCGNGVAQMIDIVRELRDTAPTTPILVHANAGLPVSRDGLAVFPETPEETALLIPELLRAGANIVGGCCGTTPDHIRAIGAALGRRC
jgi:5-methyltetrahydrofolate--homocysteine methyltransferase